MRGLLSRKTFGGFDFSRVAGRVTSGVVVILAPTGGRQEICKQITVSKVSHDIEIGSSRHDNGLLRLLQDSVSRLP